MCTAITLHTKDHYFGRNLDYETTFGERVVLTPRQYPLKYKCLSERIREDNHFAMLGTAVVVQDYPLYFDAFNEKGLAMAGLHFVGNAYYEEPGSRQLGNIMDRSKNPCPKRKDEIAPYELILWILSQCENVKQAKNLLERTRVVAVPFSKKIPLSPLHFMLADKKGDAIVVEPVKEGLQIYDNPVGVLTNNPPFPFQLANLNNYMNLTAKVPVNRFSPVVPLQAYSRGMGAIGLPGDMSSASRFVRSAFVRANSVCGESEQESVAQFFHILGSVEQIRGAVYLESGEYEITIYASCCNLEKGIYYYRTYEDANLRKADIKKMNPEGEMLKECGLV